MLNIATPLIPDETHSNRFQICLIQIKSVGRTTYLDTIEMCQWNRSGNYYHSG